MSHKVIVTFNPNSRLSAVSRYADRLHDAADDLFVTRTEEDLSTGRIIFRFARADGRYAMNDRAVALAAERDWRVIKKVSHMYGDGR